MGGRLKGPFVEKKLIKRIEAMNDLMKRSVIRTGPGAIDDFPQMVGHTIAVHDGRKTIPVYITEDMVGHRLESSLQLGTYKVTLACAK